jgi:hypothetical protein
MGVQRVGLTLFLNLLFPTLGSGNRVNQRPNVVRNLAVMAALSAGVMSPLGQCEDGHLLVQFPWTWNLTHILRVLPSECPVLGMRGQPTRLGDPRGKKSS